MKYFATKPQQLKDLYSHGRLVYLCITALLLAIACSPVAINIEQATSLRLFFVLRGPITPPDNVAIIALNSSSAQQLNLSDYSGNWPRTLYAQLIQKLQHANARLIVMDIAFKDAHSEKEDLALEQALHNAKNVILFKYLKRQQINTGAGIIDIEQEIPPIERFEQQALASGSFTLPKYPALVYSTHLSTILSNGLEATQPLLAYLELQKSAHANSRLEPPQYQTPLTINFYGPANTLSTMAISKALTLEPSQFKQHFQGKIVYIGYSDNAQTEQQDVYRTVFSSDLGVDLSGVEISATVLSNLIEGSYIRSPSPWLLLLISLTTLAVVILSYRLSPYLSWGLQTLCAFLYLACAYSLFNSHNIWLPIALPCMALFTSNSFMLIKRFNTNKKRIQHIQFALNQYLPTEAAKKLSLNVKALEQQHHLVHGVCLMTDIQGYTSLSETLPPSELHTLMNSYYAELVATVEKHGGFIGNLVGDGMLALWTGPSITPDMCNSALQAAQEIQQRISNNPTLQHSLPTCSALHGGQFSLGNLGAMGHFEYSPVGDIINTASRVEHFNRNLGTQFLCTTPIAEQLALVENNKTQLRHLGRFTFRHKSMAMPLYGLNENQPKELLDLYAQALEFYEREEFDKAQPLFERLVTKYSDEPSRYYVTDIQNNSGNN